MRYIQSVMFARHTGETWKAVLHFLISATYVVLFCVVMAPRPADRTAHPRPGAITWYSIATTPPTTGGGRVFVRKPSPTPKQSVQSVPPDKLGRIVFNPPDHMIVGKPELVEALITPSDLDQGVSRMMGSLKGRGTPQVKPLLVSSRMRVNLVGQDFTIRRISSSDEQWVDESEPTPWSWDVEPKRAGNLILTIKVTRVMLVSGDGLVSRDLPSLTQPVVVKADYWYSTVNWIGANTTLIIPAAVSLTISLLVPWVREHLRKRRLRRLKSEAVRKRLSR